MGAARERVRVAHALGTLPRLAEALARGELSYAKVRALTRVATPETEARLAHSGPRGNGRPCRAHRARLAAGGPSGGGAEGRPAARRPRPPCLRGRRRHGGGAGPSDARGGGVLRACAGGRARGALSEIQAGSAAASRRTRSPSRRHGPAAGGRPGDGGGAALHHALDPGAPGSATRWSSMLTRRCSPTPTQPGESALEDGAGVSAETSRRLTCDASRTVMRHDKNGHVVAIGARTRTIPPALRRALQHRDRGCRFPGCGVRIGRGASSPPLGAGRAHDALKSRAAVPEAPPRGTRGGLSGGA